MPANKTAEPHAGRVALVTGAARGIGQAVAVGLAERGARIVLGDIDDVSDTSKLISDTGHPAVAVTLDVSDPSSIEAARDRVTDALGRVDILVNNAGIFEAATWDDLDFDLWQRLMAVDLNGPMLSAASSRTWCSWTASSTRSSLRCSAARHPVWTVNSSGSAASCPRRSRPSAGTSAIFITSTAPASCRAWTRPANRASTCTANGPPRSGTRPGTTGTRARMPRAGCGEHL
jgi:NAD(P)-dependent dehydrogenase (short-subunit alcohol dehydrogenase family)